MSYWIEIRCSNQGSPEASGVRGQRCYSLDQIDPPSVLVGDNQGDVLHGLRIIGASATKDGWVKSKADGWLCPFCVKLKGQ